MEKINKLQKAFTEERCLVWISLISTPLIIFIGTSVELYLKNQIDLDNRLVTLLPFVVLFFLAVLVGYLFYFYSKKSRISKVLLFAYYLMGPAFLIYSAIRQIQFNFIIKILFFSALFCLALFYLYKKIKIAKIIRVFLWFSVLMIIGELAIIFSTVYAAKVDDQKGTHEVGAVETSNKKNLPNIYHIIFDEYQTDMFDLTLNNEVREQLAGFTYYPEATTLYGRTGMSLPSIFTGLAYDYKMPQIEYQKQAFNSDKSVLYWLKKAGYKNNAYIHKVFKFDMELFDSTIVHKENVSLKLDDASYIKLFLNLWVYANTPRMISEKIVETELFDQIKNQNILSDEAPIISRESFNNILDNEKLLDNSNQYVFAHLVLPHFPYVLKSDCLYEDGSKSSPLEQSKCATKMIADFVNILKKNGRFDNSLIIIQSDHGSRFRVEDNELVKIKNDYYSEEWSLARAKSLLLVKLPENNHDSLVASNAEVSLLDIAPTMLEAIGAEGKLKTEGNSLINPETLPLKQSRYYHFYDKLGSNDRTDELSRYIIEDEKAKFEKKIKIGESE